MTNTIFPGRPDYVGPTAGWFGLLHHDRLYEESHDVMERVAYVRANKPKSEIYTRLNNMIYLGDCPAVTKRKPLSAEYEAKLEPLDAEYRAKLEPLDAEYLAKLEALDAEYWAKRKSLNAEILAYIRAAMPDCAWDGRMLVFKPSVFARIWFFLFG